jgi:hypothetical protein
MVRYTDRQTDDRLANTYIDSCRPVSYHTPPRRRTVKALLIKQLQSNEVEVFGLYNRSRSLGTSPDTERNGGETDNSV